MLASVLFGTYKFFDIGEYPVTIFTLAAAIYLVYSILLKNRWFRFNKKTFLIVALLVTYIFVNYMILYSTKAIFWGKITSAILSAFLFAVYLQFSREMNSTQLQAEVNFFQKIINISAVYAICQMIGQLLGLPFVNPWIDGYMVEGYNWTETGTTTVSLGGIVLHRTHALFVEPSIMSQFLAINILIYAYNWDRRSLEYVILNALALILSFSGTGILLLIGGVAYMLLVNKSKK